MVNDYQELSEKVANEIISFMLNKEKKLICLPSGDTPIGAYKIICEKLNGINVNDLNVKFVGLGEWVGFGRDTVGSCQNYMFKNLYKPLSINNEKIVEFNARSSNLEMECNRIDKLIDREGPLDLVVLGIGVNGHLGLNEPKTSFQQKSHVVKLTESTKKVAQKYFTENVNLENGITLGIHHFLESKRLILIAAGKKKADIIKQIIDGEVTVEIPATAARLHQNCSLIIDKEAASAL
jgi:glucosamine-6-phosphate isomerase